MKHALIGCLACLAVSVQAQSAAELIARADAQDARQNTAAAMSLYLAAEKLEASNAALLIKIAKQYGESMTVIKDAAARQRAGETALSYAQRAVQLAPSLSDAHLAAAICYGRLLDLVPARTRVEYSRLVKQEAEQALQLDPRNDYAWHMLGRWHQAVATMDGLTRALMKLVYGGLPDASLDEAVRCFQQALKLRGDRVAHQIELGRTFALLGRKEEARRSLERGLQMPERERDDPGTKQRGREALMQL